MREQLEQFVKRVKERHEYCRQNEQATKASLIAPLFALLGYDTADPRECIPEYRTDFGRGERATTPVDWAFLINGTPAFIVEAKEVGAKLKQYAEQLGMYFGKGQPHVKLGIYTNGLHWQFFTDLLIPNVMDKEPFLKWDVLKDEKPPYDFLTLLHKSQFKTELVRTFAKSWKEMVASAIEERAKQRTLASVPTRSPPQDETEPRTDEDETESPTDGPDRRRLRKKFWQGLLGRPKMKGTRHAHLKAGKSSLFVAPAGVRGMIFRYRIRKNEGTVDLYIDRGVEKAAENKELFDRLHKHKEEIEKTFGKGLWWQPASPRHCGIGYNVTLGGYRSPESLWPEIQDAMIDAMGRLEKALLPHL